MNLFEASENGDLVNVRELLYVHELDEGPDEGRKGVDPNITDENGRTPLSYASREGHLEVVKELLTAPPGGKGADPNIADDYGETPLILASLNEHLEIVKVLLLAEADPNIADKDGDTSLLWAYLNGNLEIAKVLLFNGADPNIVNEDGQTPLSWASSNKHLELVEELENYFPTLNNLSLRCIRKFRVNIIILNSFLTI